MTAAVIILSLALVVMLTLYWLQRREIRSITKQLSDLKRMDTNVLVRSENGSADRLIIQINLLLKQMREMHTQYNRKNHALDQMMTNISHDLRTPLTSAMGYIDLILHSDLAEDEKQRELAIIERRLMRLEELINSFFELSKVISGGKQPEKTELNLISVLEESIANYYDDYCGGGRQIVFRCGVRKLMIESNRNMLLRIFDNLIGNALKHGINDLTVEVEAGEQIRLTFSNLLASYDIDTEHIFDEFYTTDISRTKGNTGLGLAIARQFTEMLGGQISAALENGRFCLTVIL